MIKVLLICLFKLGMSQDFHFIKRTHQVNESQKFTLEEIPEIQAQFDQSFQINETHEFYFFKDVYNTINVTLQNITDFEMYIDLTSPWSWYKSSECKYANESLKDFLSLDSLNQSCFTEFNKSLHIDGDSATESRVTSDTQQIQGEIKDLNISMGNTTVEVKALEVSQIVSPVQYLADGALSFAQNNNSFISAYLGQSNKLVQFSQNKISFINNATNVVKINNLNHTHQWRINVTTITLYNNKAHQQIDEHVINIAILSLNTQFIALPKHLLERVIKALTFENPVTKCEFIDQNLYALKCSNLFQSQLNKFDFTLNLDNLNITLKTDSLIKSCSNNTKGQKDCIFNIRASQSQFLILGEPFINEIIITQGTLGYIKLMETKVEDLEYTRMQQWIIGLTLLLVLAFCVLNIKPFYKWVVRAIKYRKVIWQFMQAVNTEDEQQLRNKEVEIGEMEKAEQMTQSIEENSI